MFQMTIKAHSPQELRTKIFEAARAFEEDRISSEPPVGINVPVDFAGDEEDGPTVVVPTPMIDTHTTPFPDAPTFQAPKQSSAPATAGGERDARGLPWDERIHAATKTKNKDGSWRNKRGIEEAYIFQIETELRAAGPQQTITQIAAQTPSPQVAPPPIATAPQVAAPAPFIPPTPPAPTIQVEMPNFTAPVAAPATPPSAMQPSVAVSPSYENIPVPTQSTKPAHTFETFRANIIKVFVDLLSSQKITQDYIEKLKAHFGVKEAWDVAQDEAKARELFENFVQYGLITKVG